MKATSSRTEKRPERPRRAGAGKDSNGYPRMKVYDFFSVRGSKLVLMFSPKRSLPC
jgi:hypothetical protein